MMGDMADFMEMQLDRALEEESKAWEAEQRLKTKRVYWTTREGERILIQDMTDSHLDNSINMLERNIKSGRYKNQSLEQEPSHDDELEVKKKHDLKILIKERLLRKKD